ncbi:MAG: sulfite exporter TauE/SafE family protein [Methanothrix sp.]|nr:sulfite exporter TauE/SafE family protein [Methanothrix sp.]
MILDIHLQYILALLGAGVVVGFACGLLGIGGGFIMVPVQIWALTSTGIEPTIATRIAFGTSLAVILPTALCGCYGHNCRGVVLLRPGLALGLSGLLGAVMGGTIAAHAPADLLKAIFGMVVIAGAMRMLLAEKILLRGVSLAKPSEEIMPYIPWGMAVGVVSGLTGIGGGVILVPVMTIAMGFNIFQAIGTSSVAIAFNAVGGTFAYIVNGWGVSGLPAYSLGYIDLFQFMLLAGTSVLTAQLGVKAAHRLPAEQLRYIFMILMIYVGLKMMGVFAFLGLPI